MTFSTMYNVQRPNSVFILSKVDLRLTRKSHSDLDVKWCTICITYTVLPCFKDHQENRTTQESGPLIDQPKATGERTMFQS